MLGQINIGNLPITGFSRKSAVSNLSRAVPAFVFLTAHYLRVVRLRIAA